MIRAVHSEPIFFGWHSAYSRYCQSNDATLQLVCLAVDTLLIKRNYELKMLDFWRDERLLLILIVLMFDTQRLPVSSNFLSYILSWHFGSLSFNHFSLVPKRVEKKCSLLKA